VTDNYDRIARFYDTDMALNMAFDDVGFYATRCAEAGGPVLELGCGNGRILLPLLDRGFDVTGVDASAGMLDGLRRKAADRGLVPRIARMDARALAFAGAFGIVLCPYSLVTYQVTADDVDRLFDGVQRALRAGGRFVVDAFVPRPAAASAEFGLDYRRPYDSGFLVRSKRVTPLPDGCNRIERRYEVVTAAGRTIDCVEVSEEIRPVSPEGLVAALEGRGFRMVESWWDYGTRATAAGAQFFTAVAQVP
jgi:SAM-dependent methyltransferase